VSRLDIFKNMINERRLGFEIDEEMSGTHHFKIQDKPQGELPMFFKVTWGAKNIGKFLNPMDPEFLAAYLFGRVTIGGFCEDTECRGSLELLYFTEAKIRYTFDFQVEGERYRYVGEKVNIRPWNLHRTHTTCYGIVRNIKTGDVISESTLHFRFSTIPAFLGSLRPA